MTTLTDDGALRRVQAVDPAQCPDLVQRLVELRPQWASRGNAFYTLGAATYLDVCGTPGLDRYDAFHRLTNPILSTHFGDVLGRVRDVLEDVVGAPCRLTDRFALPGFHIFLAQSLQQRFRDNLHLDLQHTYLPFDAELTTPTLTFTLPLSLPAGGAGIEFCHRQGGDPRGVLSVERYHLGELLIHSGRALHRRAHLPASDQCMRITLQGHGLRVGSEWILYW